MIHVEYESFDEAPIIHVFGRDKDGKRVHTTDSNFRPYFYVHQNEKCVFENDQRVLLAEDVDLVDIAGTKVSKITCKIPKYVSELRKLASETFEADILYPIRYMIDKYDVVEQSPLSSCYIDIETNSSMAFPNTKTATDEITCITAHNDLSDKTVTFVWREDQEERIERRDDSIILYFKEEIPMLNKFLKYIIDTDPDLFTGWNVKSFDLTYIINRMNTLGVDYTRMSPMNVALINEHDDVLIKGRIIFDMLEAYKKMSYGELVSYKLDNIAFDELGERKVKFSGGTGNLWRTDLQKLIEYNQKDVMLVVRIQKKKKIIESFDEMRRLAKCSFNDVFNNSRVVDSYILSYCKGRTVMPTKSHKEGEKFGGGKVLKPKKGIHSWVSVFDFSSLYPKIISSLNSSPETIAKVKTDKTVNLHIPYVDDSMFYEEEEFKEAKFKKATAEFDAFFEKSWDLHKQEFSEKLPVSIAEFVKFKDVSFNQDVKGFVPVIMEHLFDERVKIQEERDTHAYGTEEYNRLELKQFSFKLVVNSVYGVLGFSQFRLYKPEIAASITFIGRNALLWNKMVAEKSNYEVISGDTDSIFCQMHYTPDQDPQAIINESDSVQKLLTESYPAFAKLFNMNKHYLEIKFEKALERVFFGQAKKRYAYKNFIYKNKRASDIKIVGFEAIRTDNSKVARATQKEVFSMLLEKKSTKDEIVSFVRNTMKNIEDGKYDYESLGIPTPLKKSLGEYKSNIPAVRAVIYSNRYLKLDIRPGEKFFLLCVKHIPSLPQTDVIAFRSNEDVPEGVVMDYHKHTEEATLDMVKAIFDGLGWDETDLSGQSSLLEF